MISITLQIGGQPLVAELDDDAVAALAAAVTRRLELEPTSEFLTIRDAALLLRCGYKPCPKCEGDDCRRCRGTGEIVNRARIDDLLSQRRIPRVKDGARTLIRRSDLDAYLQHGGNQRRGTTQSPRVSKGEP